MASLQTAQVANYDFGATAAAIVLEADATATITLAAQPASGDVVVIGTSKGTFTYEFTSSTPAANHIGVTIGANANATAANLTAAINAQSNQGAKAVNTGAPSALVTLTDTNDVGSLGNQNTISDNDANVNITAWTGGADDSSSVGVLVFSVKDSGGGKAILHFEAPINGPNGIGIRPPTNPLTISVQVAPTLQGPWAATTSTNNGTAVTGVTVGPGQSQDYVVELRAGVDKFVRVNAQGPGRGLLQIRSQQSVGLDIVEI